MSRLAARVLTGSTLALVAVGLLFLEHRAPDGLVAWACATGIALLTSWELANMGAFRARGFGPPLYAATLGVSAAVWLGFGGFGMYTLTSSPAGSELSIDILLVANPIVASPFRGYSTSTTSLNERPLLDAEKDVIISFIDP